MYVEFIITDYYYYLPFKDSNDCIVGLTREHIVLKGSFIGLYESPNNVTRELLKSIKVNHQNTSEEFNIFIATEDELKNLNHSDELGKANTKMNLKVFEDRLTLRGSIYLSEKSFNQVKNLISVLPNSNSYFNFETIVLGDKVKNELPLEVDFQSTTSGLEMKFTVQNIQKKYT
jgi:hypothetical protein